MREEEGGSVFPAADALIAVGARHCRVGFRRRPLAHPTMPPRSRQRCRHPRASGDPRFGGDQGWVLACARMTGGQYFPRRCPHCRRRAALQGGIPAALPSSPRKRGPTFRRRPRLGPRMREDDGGSVFPAADVLIAAGAQHCRVGLRQRCRHPRASGDPRSGDDKVGSSHARGGRGGSISRRRCPHCRRRAALQGGTPAALPSSPRKRGPTFRRR